jgi:hypothetical protein
VRYLGLANSVEEQNPSTSGYVHFGVSGAWGSWEMSRAVTHLQKLFEC